jgi:phosphoribosylaminoimidazole-succinocarboxamide synthase
MRKEKQMAENTLCITNISGIDLFKRGKVRDVYDLKDMLLVVSTDRISCFDVVLPTCIPDKGRLLTGMSAFWFEFTNDIIPNHYITSNTEEYPKSLHRYTDTLTRRSMLVKKADAIPIECVVRGYLSGSGLKEYRETGSVCNINLGAGLKESDKLSEPIFTPSTKEDSGHDINVSQAFVENKIGKGLADKLKDISICIYSKASAYAESKGIIIADTKFEFGMYKGDMILIDEALTPDSSRFWPKDRYSPGRAQPSFDKQFVRDYLETLDWDKTPPGPELPDEIVKRTREKYVQSYQMLTGRIW